MHYLGRKRFLENVFLTLNNFCNSKIILSLSELFNTYFKLGTWYCLKYYDSKLLLIKPTINMSRLKKKTLYLYITYQ